MFFVSEIPHLKASRQKAYLPVDKKLQSMYSVVMVNNNSTQSTINLMNHKLLLSNNKFHQYFMDNIYSGKILKKTYRKVLTKERALLYDEVETGSRYITTQLGFTNVNNRNVFFELQKYNEIFFTMAKKAISNKIKSEEYIDFLKERINDTRLANYKHKIVATDIESWLKSADGRNKMDTPFYLLYFAMFRNFEKFQELGNVDLVFYSDTMMIRVNPSLCNTNSYRLFKTELLRISKTMVFDEDAVIDADEKKREVYNHVVNAFVQRYNFTGEDNVDELEEKIKDRIDEIEEAEEVPLEGKALEDKLSKVLQNDEKFIKEIYVHSQEKKIGKTDFSTKRDQELREKQKQLKIDNMTLEELQNTETRKITLDKTDIKDKVKTTNKNLTTVSFPNFEKSYNENLMKKDTMNILTSLNDKALPVFVRDVTIEDTSTELNLKETYTIDFEDGNRVRHRVKVDMPKFIDDKFMYLNGNKKLIVKQLFMKPVVKTGPDEVQIISNYKKIFIRRYGAKMSAKIEKFKKAYNVPGLKGVTVKTGNNLSSNNKFKSIIEYDEISRDLTYLKVDNFEFYFNQEEVQSLLKKYNKKVREDQMCIGFVTVNNDRQTICVDYETQNVMDGTDIVDYIMGIENKGLVSEYTNASTGKKFVYTRATIMSKQVPIALLLGYTEGITSVLRKAKIQHYFSDSRPKIDVAKQGTVQFANGYLVFDRYPFENSLLMNAFVDIPTKAFNYEDFDDKETYLTIFDAMFNARNIGNAFDNFYEFMIDPITKEVLEDLGYPTDFVSLVLYASSLLTDNAYISENNMELYRVRSNELVNAFLYEAISGAYSRYRPTANNNNPVKISIPQDYVLKKVLMAQTVEDYSTLNPIVELEKSRAITPKGYSGMNLDAAYTQDKRSYDGTMLGILAMSTSPDANCGIVRQLSMEPNIIGPRGYIELKNDKLDELTDANLFSPAELLSPLGVTRDDSIRTAMATKQSKHIIPIEKSSPVLISNGAEQVMHYHLSDDFSIVAKYDGEVVEVNEETGIIIIEYTDKKGISKSTGDKKTVMHQAIDTTPNVVKNGAGGFYLSNKLACKLKKGQKFKKNDILAYDEKFFSDSKIDGNRFNIGSLQKVAVMSTYSTYEDSTFITKKLSMDMAADIVMQKGVVLGKNANLDYIVKVGDKIQVGDELLRFETSFEDDSLNKFLSSIGEELQEEIKSLGKTPIKSKYSGVIEDIKIYSTVELNELSPSLRKLVQGYYTRIDKKKKLINKYDDSTSTHKLGVLLNDATGKIETKDGKLKGTEVGEGILIEFYIKYRDVMGVGDKMTFFTALKSIIGEVIPEGLEPYSEYRADEEISSVIAPGAILARMTPSILLTMFGNKVLVELKRELEEIYTGKQWTGK